jgi:threonine synthase
VFWRYAKALLVDAADAVSMGEGWTPLVSRDWDGIPVRMKLEFMMPTGSFKDRGMTELWEQLGFRAPHNVIVPLGYGSNILGCERGFAELMRNGEISRVPRLFGIQAANCAPYHEAFKAGADHLLPTAITATVAEGIASSQPARVREVLAAVRDSGGAIVAVSGCVKIHALCNPII